MKQRFYDVAMIAKREERARIRRKQAAVIAEMRGKWIPYSEAGKQSEEWADRLEEATRDE